MAQGKLKVQGIVTDEENGEPLIGVTVKIVGDNKTWCYYRFERGIFYNGEKRR
ncbi:carboxypeptidase-like regulatory domain-containing protein [Bacteroides xylanisolvens]|nr:carboxypeptidase-like regulatory domain-containing protein [Bacteroides xylanisolvens]